MASMQHRDCESMIYAGVVEREEEVAAASGNGSASVAPPTPTLHKEAIGDDELAANVERLFPFPFFVCSRRGMEPPITGEPRVRPRAHARLPRRVGKF